MSAANLFLPAIETATSRTPGAVAARPAAPAAVTARSAAPAAVTARTAAPAARGHRMCTEANKQKWKQENRSRKLHLKKLFPNAKAYKFINVNEVYLQYMIMERKNERLRQVCRELAQLIEMHRLALGPQFRREGHYA